MAQHIFKGRVLHNKKEFVKGQACPEELLKEMQDIGLVEALPEAVKPVEHKQVSEPKRSAEFSKKHG